MKRIVLALSLAFAAPVMAEPVAVVNGEPISEEALNFNINAMSARGMANNEENRKAVLEDLITRQVLVSEAVKQGIDKDEQINFLIETARQELLISGLMRQWLENNPASEQEIDEAYQAMVEEAKGVKEYQVRHILVDDEAQAKSLLEQIKGDKTSFEDAAKTHSKDIGSGAQGGNLGWSEADNYVPEFAQAVREAKLNELVAEPVQSQFGWHIIEVTDARDITPPSREEAEAALAQVVQQNKMSEYMDGLRAEAKVESRLLEE